MVPPIDHDCPLKDLVVELSNKLAKVEHELALMKKAHVGPKTERSKMPRIDDGKKKTPEEKLATRRERARAKAQIQTVRTEHKVPDEQRCCPHCGNDKLTPLGKGEVRIRWEFVPATFIRHEHVHEKLRCKCNGYVVTAPGVPSVIEKSPYGATFLAHLAVSKCADHIPLYRLEKDFARQGIPIARSTMNGLLHRMSEMTRPIWIRVLDDIRVRALVQADETRMRMQDGGDGKPKNGFVWTFVARDDEGELDVALVFAADRSGETPRRILAGTKGYMLVDMYSGYNDVADVSTRKRAACHAHLRRYFHDALKTAPIAQEAIDFIRELYAIEHDARDRGVLGTNSHLEFRRQRAGPIRDRLKEWLERQRGIQLPKSPIGTAIRYALNNWEELGRFLEDARIPLDNNASEAALRRVALGRKNFLFVGDVDAGTNIAGLYTLIATCEARGINPFAYLADIITRVGDAGDDPERIAELLPGAWLRARTAASTGEPQASLPQQAATSDA
jgi:transposase